MKAKLLQAVSFSVGGSLLPADFVIDVVPSTIKIGNRMAYEIVSGDHIGSLLMADFLDFSPVADEIAALKAQLVATTDARLHASDGELALAGIDSEVHRRQLSDARDEISVLRERVKALEYMVQVRDQQLAAAHELGDDDSSDTIATFRADLDRMETRMLMYRRRLEEVRTEAKDLRNGIKAMGQEVLTIAANYAALEKMFEIKVKECVALDSRLTASHKDAQTQMVAYEELRERLEKRIAESVQMCDYLAKDAEQLKQAWDRKVRDSACWYEKYNAERAKTAELENAIHKLPIPPASMGDGPDERVGNALKLLDELKQAVTKEQGKVSIWRVIDERWAKMYVEVQEEVVRLQKLLYPNLCTGVQQDVPAPQDAPAVVSIQVEALKALRDAAERAGNYGDASDWDKAIKIIVESR